MEFIIFTSYPVLLWILFLDLQHLHLLSCPPRNLDFSIYIFLQSSIYKPVTSSGVFISRIPPFVIPDATLLVELLFVSCLDWGVHPLSYITLCSRTMLPKCGVTLWASIFNQTELKLFHVTSKYLNDVTWAHSPPQGLPLLFLWHGCHATCSYLNLVLVLPSPPLRLSLQHPASSLLHHIFGSIGSLICPLSWLSTFFCG